MAIQETMAAFICEQVLDPQKVSVKYVKNDLGLEYIKFRACLQTYNNFNRNNRWYELMPMKKTWAAPHIKEMINRGDWFGEAGHPISDDPKRIVTIDPKVASHRITGYEFKGNAVYGDIETLADGPGTHAYAFMKRTLQGCCPAFSIRALVPLTKVDAKRTKVLSPGHLIAVDQVILPSHKDAYADISGGVELVRTTTQASESTIVIPEGNTNDNYTVAAESIGPEFLNYIVEESVNIKTVLNNFEVEMESASFDFKRNKIIVREAAQADGFRRTAIIKADDYIQKEVSNILANL